MTVLRAGSLFSGYEGLGMAVEQVFGARTVWHSEYEPATKANPHPKQAAAKILAHHWPTVPNHGDITAIDWDQVETVDLLAAGYPCQPFSDAGLRKGEADVRYLWPEVIRAARAMGPRYIVLENVRGHLGRGFNRVLGDLTDLRYDVRWVVVPASAAGAPHRRLRLFALATNTERSRRDGRTWTPRPRRWDEPAYRGADAPTDTASDGRHQGWAEPARLIGRPHVAQCRDAASHAVHDGCQGRQERDRRQEGGQPTPLRGDAHGRPVWGQYEPAIRRWEAVLGRPAPEPTEPGTRGNRRLSPHFVEWLMGLPAGHVTAVPGLTRNEQLKALGNGVVPQQAVLALRHLVRITAQLAPVEVPA